MKQRLWTVMQADHDLAEEPTRPHPHTPPNPTVLAAVGPLAARLDRARDALTGRKVPTP